jgi:alpha-tubulin suppressor-like RCC1 family protein
VSDFTCGEEHSALVDEHGQVHTWGLGIDGQLGHGNKDSVNTPTKITNFEPKAKIVKCGAGHTGIVTHSGDLYLMGRGRDGQLGRGSELESNATERTVPTLVEFFRSQNMHVEDLALGANHTIALASPRVSGLKK